MAGSALSVWRRWPARRRTVPATVPLPGIDLAEAADIDARLVAIGGAAPPRGLELRLSPLVDRSVPLRYVSAAPYFRTCRARFADGTTVLVRGARSGDVALLLMAVRSRSLPPLACWTDVEGTHLVFAWPRGSGTLSLLVTGMDQSD